MRRKLRHAGCRRHVAVLVLCTLAAADSIGAHAAPSPGENQRYAQARPPGDRREDSRRVQISEAQAAAIAASRTGGRVLDVKLHDGRRPRYHVRVLVQGERVRTVTVDAVTGAFEG